MHGITLTKRACLARSNFPDLLKLRKQDVDTCCFFQLLRQSITLCHSHCDVLRRSRMERGSPPLTTQQIKTDLSYVSEIIRHLHNTGKGFYIRVRNNTGQSDGNLFGSQQANPPDRSLRSTVSVFHFTQGIIDRRPAVQTDSDSNFMMFQILCDRIRH